MKPWLDRDLAEIQRACTAGRLIVAGPLNNAYSAELDGRPVFIRQRVVQNEEYGQTFAAERFVYRLLGQNIRVPPLLYIGKDNIRPVCAVFEFVPSIPTDWTDPDNLIRLAETLASIHEIRGDRLGDIGQESDADDVVEFLYTLYTNEICRAPSEVVDDLGHGILESWATGVESVFRNEPIVLCHGDIRAANILSDEEANLWLVDWEAARFRVAGSDFNQIHFGWLNRDQEEAVVAEYSKMTSREPGALRTQINSLRILWHIRTLNFYTRVHCRPVSEQSNHISMARQLLYTSYHQR